MRCVHAPVSERADAFRLTPLEPHIGRIRARRQPFTSLDANSPTGRERAQQDAVRARTSTFGGSCGLHGPSHRHQWPSHPGARAGVTLSARCIRGSWRLVVFAISFVGPYGLAVASNALGPALAQRAGSDCDTHPRLPARLRGLRLGPPGDLPPGDYTTQHPIPRSISAAAADRPSPTGVMSPNPTGVMVTMPHHRATRRPR